MSGDIDPINNPSAWDTVTIGSQVSPGLCKVSDFKSKNEWDIKKGKGTLGATITSVIDRSFMNVKGSAAHVSPLSALE